ncbi:MAG: hypothetical protein HY064_03715 [Bacteroidetes bacterium]|nr:hypothetical protein [Bacteroidota bacterium]
MAESLTISQLPPPFKSMQYDLLRAEGLKHIQELSGKVWTDDNFHDPGITILEVLAYAITDLGYRTNYNIKDILTTDPNVPEDIKNFFQAKEIMPNYPVTFNDYRKLMIDVEIPVTNPPFCDFLGVQNAWIEKSKDNEIPFYVDTLNRTLTYTQPDPSVNRSQPKVLYDVLLEFSSCESLGDLNANTLDSTLKLHLLSSLPPNVNQLDPNLNGVKIKFEIEFPSWDAPGIDWTSVASIKANMRGITMDFIGLPEQYTVDSYGLTPNGDAWVNLVFNFIFPVDDTAINYELNQLIYNLVVPDPNIIPLITTYQEKVAKINEVVAAVHKRLMANRNLGEDFFRYKAIKIDEIALCAEIDVENNAEVEFVQAEVFHAVEKFLDPAVTFYSLTEMYDKGYTTDQIFEGPLLQHGFIDDKELKLAERRKTIHVSDLINIIMDIPGVIAIKSIQIAGIPLDNITNIPVETVRWCLEVPLEENYVPRLSVDRSKLLFFKDQLPYRANAVKAQEFLDQLEASDRRQKIENPDDDIHLTPGEYKDIQNYYSIQEEFPLVYGIGSPGLPSTATVQRFAQAKQLKGFLLFYDQLLADFLSQLFHVKDLFSMNDALDTNGDPVINKTYFSQSLVNIIPDALPLYMDPVNDAAIVQAFAENRDTFLQRRNRFLDHLMARFAESFNDYAMVVYKIDGPKAPDDLIADKLAFLNNYPLISSARDTGFNYKSPCNIWSIDNISGLERRVSFLCGVDKPQPSILAFGVNFDIRVAANPDEFYFVVLDSSLPRDLVFSPGAIATGFESTDAAKGALELLIIAGLTPEHFVMFNVNNDVITDPMNPGPSPYHFEIICEGNVLGINAQSYPMPADFAQMQTDIASAIQIIYNEFFDNPESNRYNLECFMDKYITTSGPFFPMPPAGCPAIYTYDFTLKDGNTITATTLLTGTIKGLEVELDPPVPVAIQAAENKERLLMDMLRDGSDFNNYRYAFDPMDPSKEIFTVVDRCGDVVASSFEDDFNQHIQGLMLAISLLPPTDNVFQVVASSGNDNPYTAYSISVDLVNPQRLIFTPNETIMSPIGDGFIRFDIDDRPSMSGLIPHVIDANTGDNYFKVDKSLSRIVFPGQKVTISGGPDVGDFVVVKVVPDGTSNSLVYVKEKIPSTTPGYVVMKYSKLVPIVAVNITGSNNKFYIKPGADEVAAKYMADWIRLKFFNHEGMHVVENILLRPKFNELGPPMTISAANNNQLQNVNPLGKATFLKQFAVTALSQPNKTFTFAGNYAGDVQPLQSMRIVGSTANDGTYTIRSAVDSGTDTIITIYESIPGATANGNLQYSKTYVIQSESGGDTITITDPFFVTPANNAVIITDSLEDINNGRFHVSNAVSGSITFDRRVAVISDDFLPIELHNDCIFCRFDDPYSFIISVILPAWQGRFFNQDFRRFFERTLRLECPAHLVMNVCWIDCKQMGEFEHKYKKWLLQNAKDTIDKLELSRALNELIEVLKQLRTVYPTGILHDCNADTGPENAIILNNTVLGNL